jgi:hypothetical protein
MSSYQEDVIPTFVAWILDHQDLTNLTGSFNFLRALVLGDQIQEGESIREICSLKSVLSAENPLAVAKYIGLLDSLHSDALIPELTFDEPLSVMLQTEEMQPGLFHSTEELKLANHLLRESRGRAISWCSWVLSFAGDSLISLFVVEFETVAEFLDSEFCLFGIVACVFQSEFATQQRTQRWCIVRLHEGLGKAARHQARRKAGQGAGDLSLCSSRRSMPDVGMQSQLSGGELRQHRVLR